MIVLVTQSAAEVNGRNKHFQNAIYVIYSTCFFPLILRVTSAAAIWTKCPFFQFNAIAPCSITTIS